MKTILSLCLALLAATSLQAQIFRSHALKGAVLGGLAGGVIGDFHHDGWRGAAIGATAGLLIGQAIGDARAHRDYGRHRGGHGGYGYHSSPRVHVGIGYGHSSFGGWSRGHRGHFDHFGHGGFHRGHHGYGGIGWNLSYGPSFSYHRGYGWEYPHIGYSDYVYRAERQPVFVQQPQPVYVQAPVAPVQPAQPAPQQVTIINNYYNTPSPMSGANGLFGR